MILLYFQQLIIMIIQQMIQTPLRFWMSTNKIASNFKIRSRLGQFFKHVHPDQLNQAPTNVKQQNLRSLTNLNSYIDAVNQSKPVQSKLLKFYLAQKTNLKSKKFYSFNVQLPEINNRNGQQLGEERVKKLVDSIVDVLNTKFKQSKNVNKKTSTSRVTLSQDQQSKNNDEVLDKPTEKERFNKFAQVIQPYKKNSLKQDEEKLKNVLNEKYMQAEKDDLSAQLKKNISFADTSTNKQMLWSRLTAQQSGIYKDFQQILSSLIDPRLIYFDQQLSLEEIQQFKKKLLPGSLDRTSHKNSEIISQVCQKLESSNPPLCFYVSKQYSGSKIPGFFTVPYNFQAQQLAEKFEELYETIVEQQQKYEQYYDYYVELCTSLSKNNGMSIDIPEFKNNEDIWMRILALKRLQKYSLKQLNSPNIKVIVFNNQQFSIFKHKYQIKNSRTVVLHDTKIVIVVDFAQQELESLILMLNGQSRIIS